jgi:hypothetical protein
VTSIPAGFSATTGRVHVLFMSFPLDLREASLF